MPAAAIDAENRLWLTKDRGTGNTGYLFNHKALAKVFRATLLDATPPRALNFPPAIPTPGWWM